MDDNSTIHTVQVTTTTTTTAMECAEANGPKICISTCGDSASNDAVTRRTRKRARFLPNKKCDDDKEEDYDDGNDDNSRSSSSTCFASCVHVTLYTVENFKSTLTDDERQQYWYTCTDYDRFKREWEYCQHYCNESSKSTTINTVTTTKRKVKSKDWANQVNHILGIDEENTNVNSTKTIDRTPDVKVDTGSLSCHDTTTTKKKNHHHHPCGINKRSCSNNRSGAVVLSPLKQLQKVRERRSPFCRKESYACSFRQ
jgi:hypothetical protein